MFWVCCTSNNRFFFMNLRFCFVLIKVDVCSSAELAEFTVYHELYGLSSSSAELAEFFG